MRHTLALTALVALGVGASTASAQDDYARYAPPFTPAWAAPQLHVEPPDGPPGTWVLITGADFDRDAQVFYGDVPMPVVEVDEGRIVAIVPQVRGDDFIYVVDDTGRARTAVPFGMHRGRYDRTDRFHPPEDRGWPLHWDRPHDVPWMAPPPPDRY